MQLLGVVDEEASLLLITLQEMFSGNLQRLGHTLTDGDAGHHDDELAPAIQLVQLENGLDVAVGLTRAGFHLHVQIHAGDLGFGQRVGNGQILLALYLLNVVEQSSIRQY